ncbi:MAG: hypothetical protein KCHDKBKB_02646 [Elusimicrobia bacterium]|nr:hypothetical protein [Elusimicrobiota bacterium]
MAPSNDPRFHQSHIEFWRDCCNDEDAMKKTRVLFLIISFIIGALPQGWAENVLSDKEILKVSQLSYQAEGGFSGVQSYGVILSCVNGQVSLLKTIHDPRFPSDKAILRQIGHMATEDYLKLWNTLDRHGIFKTANAPKPKMDIMDEFTVRFHAKVGERHHQFDVYGISRPEAARYFSLQKLIDNSVQMQSLWTVHNETAKKFGQTARQ